MFWTALGHSDTFRCAKPHGSAGEKAQIRAPDGHRRGWHALCRIAGESVLTRFLAMLLRTTLMITKYTSRTSQLLGLIVLFAFGLVYPAQAQSTVDANSQEAPALGTWHQTIGQQHAKMLRSHDEALQVTAMQNLIVLSAQRPGEFDLTPAVPALLGIYADDANDAQQRIMAVAALRAVGDTRGMNELYRLSDEERNGSRLQQVAQNAVRHYYTEEAMEREEARSAYHLAKGDVEKAAKHAARAAEHRSKLG